MKSQSHLQIGHSIKFVCIFCLVGLSTFFCSMAFAINESAQTFTLDGKLFHVGTTNAMLDSNVKLTIQILNPGGTCLLYEEEQNVSTATSDGHFTAYVGSATGASKRTVNDPGRTMAQVFQNSVPISANSVPGQTCAGALYTPVAGAVRYFRIIVTPSLTNIPNTLTPDLVIDSVPSAIVAQSLQGVERSQILQVNNSGSTVLTQSNLEALFTTPAYANLQSILAGNFIKTDTSGASLPSYAADPAGVANGDIWFDTLTNEIKYKNAAGVQVVGTSSGGGISSLTVGSSMSINGTVAGTISSAGTIDLTNTGVTAGSYAKVTVDIKGRVTGGLTLAETDIPTLSTAGKVSGNAITSGTISGSAGINTSGNIITTGTVSGLTVQATNLRVYNGSNYVEMSAPVLSGNVNLTLPVDDGNAGEVLKTDGSGVLSWISALTTSLASGKIWVGNATGVATAVDLSGDATISNTGILTLNKVPVTKGGTNATAFGNNRIIGTNGTGTALQDFTCSLNQVIAFDVSGNAICSNVSALSSALLNGGNSFAGDISVGTNDNQAFHLKTNNTIAMTISQGGNVGIGTSSPVATAKLTVNGAISTNSTSIILGDTTGNARDSSSVDIQSSRSAATQVAAGTNSTAVGINNTTGGSQPTTAIGYGNHAAASFWGGATAVGSSNTAYGSASVAVGVSNTSNGNDRGVVVGSANTVSGHFGVAMGTLNGAGTNGVALGYTNTASASGAVAIGRNVTNSIADSLQIGTSNSAKLTILSTGNVGIGTESPSTALDVSGAMTARGMSSAPSVSDVNTGRMYYDYATNKFKVSENGGSFSNLVSSGTGTTNALPKYTGDGTLGDSAISDNGTVITATRAVISTTNVIATGAAVNLATSNTHTLASVGGAAITISGQQDGGTYTLVVEDTTSRTYTFTGCTNSYFKPTNAPTTPASRTVYGLMTIKKGANWDCYITWSSGFQ